MDDEGKRHFIIPKLGLRAFPLCLVKIRSFSVVGIAKKNLFFTETVENEVEMGIPHYRNMFPTLPRSSHENSSRRKKNEQEKNIRE